MGQKQPNRIGRRLAAIVAADVAGYSRLMGLDEVGTARTLREHRAVSEIGPGASVDWPNSYSARASKKPRVSLPQLITLANICT